MTPEQIIADQRRHATVRAAVARRRGTVLSDALVPPPPKATQFVREPSRYSSREEQCEQMTRSRRRRRCRLASPDRVAAFHREQ